MPKTILVTGGTGYIGGEVIELLLGRGHSVHTTVRSKAKSEAKLHGRWPSAGERLKLFEADLMDDAGWAEANAGCDAVAHVASPFPVGVPKDENELIVPAREGTLRALRFAQEAGVTHFVQTSSSAAIGAAAGVSSTTGAATGSAATGTPSARMASACALSVARRERVLTTVTLAAASVSRK